MRITLNQLKRIIKEEVTSRMKRSRRPQEPRAMYVPELFTLEFAFISPENEEVFEDRHPEYNEEGFLLVCEEPKKCAKDFLNKVTRANPRAKSEFYGGVRSVPGWGVRIYGTPDELNKVGHIFARMDHELGGAGFSFDDSEVEVIVKEKMLPVIKNPYA